MNYSCRRSETRVPKVLRVRKRQTQTGERGSRSAIPCPRPLKHRYKLPISAREILVPGWLSI